MLLEDPGPTPRFLVCGVAWVAQLCGPGVEGGRVLTIFSRVTDDSVWLRALPKVIFSLDSDLVGHIDGGLPHHVAGAPHGDIVPGLAGLSPPPPSWAPRAFLRSGPPAHFAQWLRPAGPVASGRVPNGRAGAPGAARPGRHHCLRGAEADPPRGGPPSAYSPGLSGRRLGPPLPPPPAAAAPRLPGRPHWALGLRWVKCRGQGRARTGQGSRGGPASGRRALTGPGESRRADGSGERGCGPRRGAERARP